LRTGAANFSASELKREDNDLVVIENAEVATAFEHSFEALCRPAWADEKSDRAPVVE
jgi:hypothetical protein